MASSNTSITVSEFVSMCVCVCVCVCVCLIVFGGWALNPLTVGGVYKLKYTRRAMRLKLLLLQLRVSCYTQSSDNKLNSLPDDCV